MSTAHPDAPVTAHDPIWRPDPGQVPYSRIAEFTDFVAARTGTTYRSYTELWQWSVDDLEGFWAAVWDYFDVVSGEPYRQVLADRTMPGASWFPGATLNYAEHALRAGTDEALADRPALITVGEHGTTGQVTWRELRRQVGAAADWLRAQGVRRGDRVAGYLPNTEHAVVAFLAAASIGAVWAACAQDYGAAGAATRFGQLEPVVLFTADGYRWNGREYDRRDEVVELVRRIPSVRATVQIPNLGLDPIEGTTAWSEIVSGDAEPRFDRVDFDAPLWVLFSS
ncbi:AMP-binding protein, partial [Gordonia sp. (in: high G+C Gram-positive bacteria)]